MSRLAIKEAKHTLLIDDIEDMPHSAASYTKHNTPRTRTSRQHALHHLTDRFRDIECRSKSLFEHVDSIRPPRAKPRHDAPPELHQLQLNN